MQRKFLTSLSLIVLLNLLVKPFYILGIDAEVQIRVGEEVYGNYFSLLNFSFLLNILLDLGITNYNTRNIAQHPQLLQKHFFKILSLRLSLFILYATFTLLSGLLVGYSQYEFYLLSILMVNQFLVAIIQFSRSNFAGLHLFKTDAVISILDRSLLIVFCSVLLWTNLMGDTFRIEWFVYAQTLAYGLSALISLGILSNKVGRMRLEIKRTFSRAVLKKSFPYALLIFLMMMYNRVDAVMLERLLPDGNVQSGVYAQGFRILDAVNMFALLFAGLLLPIFSRLIKQKENVREMMELAFRILIVVSMITGIFGFWYQHELMQLRYPGVTEASGITFGFLILSFIPVSVTYVFGTLLTANGSLRHLNLMAVFGVVLNIILNFILIQSMKAEGAALATLITQIVTALIQMVLVYAIFRMKININLLWRILIFPAIIIGLLLGAQLVDLGITALQQMMIFILLSVVLAVVLGLFRIADIKQLLIRSGGEEDQGD
ncbi:MAG: oligosaccharide flippase family protein [Crocinitomicaceae bacterium]|nr:oligosaccharide flippase family protein [Crocinitomicaceae bacterium]